MRTLLARLATLAATVAAVVACDPVAIVAEASSPVSGVQVVGSGPVKKETRKASSFSKVRVAGAFQVEVRKGNPSIVVEAQQSLLKHITTQIKDGELVIMTEASMSADKPMKVRITTNNLNGLSVSGACNVEADAYSANDFSLDLSGASKVKLPLTAKNLKAELSGASEVNLTGNSPKMNLELSGAARFSGGSFKVGRANIDVSGASQADLRVDHEITGAASGASSIKYRGKPKTSVDVTGASSIDRA